VQSLIDGVAAGKIDVAVAALTVTAGREQILDFTQPFYATGLGIAVPDRSSARAACSSQTNIAAGCRIVYGVTINVWFEI
jgi:ABC-type amino acid transport substrate-binding protein